MDISSKVQFEQAGRASASVPQVRSGQRPCGQAGRQWLGFRCLRNIARVLIEIINNMSHA